MCMLTYTSFQGCIDTAIAKVAMYVYAMATMGKTFDEFDELHTICQIF